MAKPVEIRVPTRHGLVRVLIYRPPADAAPPGGAGRARRVHVQIHGGGFWGRFPEQDKHVAAYIASETGAVVIGIDYDVTPQARYPVAEEECYDIVAWVHATGAVNDWDANRISVGGFSAGGKLALNVCQFAYAEKTFRPVALVAVYAVADVTRNDRTSAKWNAKISPALQRLVNDTYFIDGARRHEPIASPLFDERLELALPPALIMTGEYDTLAPEMDAIAERLRAAGVPVVHRQFAATDHGFTHQPPVEIAGEAIGLIGEHLRGAFARP